MNDALEETVTMREIGEVLALIFGSVIRVQHCREIFHFLFLQNFHTFSVICNFCVH